MIISIPKEITPAENRVAIVPATVKEYIKKGNIVKIESGAGTGSFISDDEYKFAGAEIVSGYISCSIIKSRPALTRNINRPWRLIPIC